MVKSPIAKGRYGCYKRLTVCLLNAGLAAWAEPVAAESNPCANGIVVSEPQDYPGLVANCEVLLGLRDQLAGDRGLNWSADIPITQWDGIAVGDSGVKTLELGDSELTGVVPPELGQLSQLEWLSLYNNELTGVIPPKLGRLSQLEWLDLSGNMLIGSIPAELSQLIALRGLYLYGNQLIGSIPLDLSQLTALRGLRLDNNGLTGVIPPALGRLTGAGRVEPRRQRADRMCTGDIGQMGQRSADLLPSRAIIRCGCQRGNGHCLGRQGRALNC